jgi:YegS/Rv2252/BmrU family lipid kinase
LNPEISIAVLINPFAGGGNMLVIKSRITTFLKDQKLTYLIYEAEWPLSLIVFTHIFLVGGDGTLNYFINKHPENRVPVSIIPAGTGNDFAWKLYRNISLHDQLNIALNGKPRRVDAGTCNGRFFVNGVGIGFDGAVVKNMIGGKRLFRGWLAYYWTVIKTICVYRSVSVNVCIEHQDSSLIKPDGEQVDLRFPVKAFMLTIANGSRFGGNFMVAPQACIDDKILDLIIIRSISVWRRYLYLPKMKKGRHLSLPFVKSYKIKSVTVSSKQQIPAHLDGELMIDTSFEIKMLPDHFLFRY